MLRAIGSRVASARLSTLSSLTGQSARLTISDSRNILHGQSLFPLVSGLTFSPVRYLRKHQKDLKASRKSRARSIKLGLRSGDLDADAKPVEGKVLPMIEQKLELPIINLSREKQGTVQLDSEVFGQPIRKDLIHRVFRWQRAEARQGTHKTKSRAEVSGSGRKPHPQKGTGKARQGTRRAPHHRKGGMAHPIRPRSHAFGMPKKVVQKALKVALSAKLKEGNLVILDKTTLDSHKTKGLVEKLEGWQLKSGLVIHANEEMDPNFILAGRNIDQLNFCRQTSANVWDILRHQTLILTLQGLRDLQARLTTPRSEPEFPGQDQRFPEGYETRLGALNANGLVAATAQASTPNSVISIMQALAAQGQFAQQHRALASPNAVVRGRQPSKADKAREAREAAEVIAMAKDNVESASATSSASSSASA